MKRIKVNPNFTEVLNKTSGILKGFLKPLLIYFLLEVIETSTNKPSIKLYIFVVVILQSPGCITLRVYPLTSSDYW